MASSSQEEEPAPDGSPYLAQAETNITNNRFLEALALLRCAQPFIKQNTTPSSTGVQRYLQLQALCRIELAHASTINATTSSSTSLQAWWHVFGLENHDLSSLSSAQITSTKTTMSTAAAEGLIKDIKRHYKRLAILIHPDKCTLPCAQDTFKKLHQGMDALIESLECSERAKKRVKRQDDHNFQNSEKGVGDGDEEDEEEFAWWTEWDNPNADNLEKKTTADDVENQEMREKIAAADAEKEEEAKQDAAFLAKLNCEKLALEVRSRQDAMLSRLPPGRTMQEMKTALLRARTALIEKREEEKRQQDNSGCGGGGGSGGFLL